ncbi:hypothetical protein [Actinomadura opuntiae]|uniref:hypothetical protein n=1 Tax=Actinomadura sp. OS1-43 TaxID=604315 RepID=UPI00255A734B|nr:hypothetical protein [Actinomadura sp. OS1-43]MDL4812841.1 hypothetical protein [Actinomadura sp. OS1-43]
MTAPTWTAEDADERDLVARLEAEFPGWRIAKVSGRWWASRGPVVSEARTGADAVQAISAAELYLTLNGRRR